MKEDNWENIRGGTISGGIAFTFQNSFVIGSLKAALVSESFYYRGRLFIKDKQSPHGEAKCEKEVIKHLIECIYKKHC